MSVFRMPSLGADMEAGTLVEWLVAPGDEVRRGAVVAVVETQKGAIEIEIFEDGRIAELLVSPGTTVPVGTPLAAVAAAGEPPSAAALPASTAAAAPAGPPRAESPPGAGDTAPFPMPAGGRVPASPAARRLAAAGGIDLAAIRGTGPGGAVLSTDVAAARAGGGLAEMRRAIAAAMARSKREIPHYYLEHDVDMTAALDWLERSNAERAPPQRRLAAVLLVKAAARAAARYPEINGHFVDGAHRPSAAVHAGFAVALRGGGLVAPALRDADSASLDVLMAALRDMVARARRGRLRGSELSDPTITVSSLGGRGVARLFGVIYPPQVALVGFGRVETRPAVVGDAVRPRRRLSVTLAADHRVSDGHRGALFLGEIEALLQRPEDL